MLLITSVSEHQLSQNPQLKNLLVRLGSVGWVPDFVAVADFIPGRNNTCVLAESESFLYTPTVVKQYQRDDHDNLVIVLVTMKKLLQK